MKKGLMAITGAFHTGGGIAAVNRLVIRTLAEASYHIEIFSLIEDNAAIDHRYVPKSQAHYQVSSGNKFYFSFSVWRALITQKYDLVIADHVNVASILAPLSKLGRCRYIVWLCGVEVFQPRPDFEGRLGIKSAWKRLSISTYTKKSINERFPRLHVSVCELALDPVRYPEDSMVLGGPSQSTLSMMAVDGSSQKLGGQVILNVGQMSSENRDKGQECLLRAFRSAYERFTNAQLVLAGQGSDYSRLLTLARSFPLHLQRHIFMPGYVDEKLLDQLYHACFLFAMPSIGEGFGLVYLEAMSKAKPCIGGNVDATPYIVQDRKTGLLVDDPKSPDQVAAKIIWFLNNPEQAREMGTAGYKLLRSYYLFPQFVDRFWKAVAI